MLLFICVFWTVVLPIRYDVVMHRIIDRSGDINVFDNYYVVFSIPFHQRMNQVAIYKRHLFLFKTLETEHELKQGFVLSEGDDDSKKYKYSRRWDDTMFIGCYKLFYEERIEVKDVHTYTTSRVVVYPMDMPAMAIAKRQAGMLIVREHGKYCFSEGPVEQDDILFARPDVVSGNGTDRPFPGTLRGNYAPFFYCADE